MRRAIQQACRGKGTRCGYALGSAMAVMLLAAGCEQPNRMARYPDDALRVRYEAATTYSTCLVAGVAMAANYCLGERQFSEERIRNDLRRAGLDETCVGDLKAYVDGTTEGLHMLTVAGRLDEDPPLGVGYWLRKRGYPVIAVINRDPVDPAFNHAVVVIGISANPDDPTADIIHYLDPSSEDVLHSDPAVVFEELWARCDRAMMVIFQPPPEG